MDRKLQLSVCSEINYTFIPILLPVNFVENNLAYSVHFISE